MADLFHNVPRLYVPLSITGGQSLVLPENQSHYLKNVLRRQTGDYIRIFNPTHGEWVGKIGTVGKKLITLEIERQSRPPQEEGAEIHLFFSPIKKDRYDLLIEKAVELGVTHFHPVLFGRSIVREIKPDRINAQIIEAAEQCERLSIPILHSLKDFRKAIHEWDINIPLFAAIERVDDAIHLSQIDLKTSKAGLCVGPEGGITLEEIELLKNKNFVTPVSLGTNILRAETAVFCGLSFLSSFVHHKN